MAHANQVQRARARRGRRKKRRPALHVMDAYNPQRYSSNPDVCVRRVWTRRHPVRRKFSWDSPKKTRIPDKKLQDVWRWWEEDDHEDTF